MAIELTTSFFSAAVCVDINPLPEIVLKFLLNILSMNSLIQGSGLGQLLLQISIPFNQNYRILIVSILFIVGFALIAYLIWYHYLKKRAEWQYSLIKERNILEMRALRSQMNPHFVFNSLTAIQSLIQDKENEKAEYFLLKFSRLLRQIIDKSSENHTSLADELNWIQNYIDIQNLRFKKKFEFETKISKKINAENIIIPGMIIPPFIENALDHGLFNKKQKGSLFITAYTKNKQLHISIIDNGIGRLKSHELNRQKTYVKKPIGFNNVARRLDLLNQEGHELPNSFRIVDLYDKNNNETGTCVMIKLNYKKRKVSEESEV